MFPQELFLGITLYDIFFTAGLIGALFCFRKLADRINMNAKLYNLCLFDAVLAMIVGVFSSIVFQAYYNYKESGVFEINKNTGMTFLGGLLGAAAVFLLVYFLAGRRLFADNLHLKGSWTLLEMAGCCIPLAHALGRLGCFSAGCCHGIPADRPWGVYMAFAGTTVLPVQLYESCFLFLLFFVLLNRFKKEKRGNLPLYMIGYGVWRFLIEYLRGDDRGRTFVSFVTPSQLTALLLIVGGAALWFVTKKWGVYPTFGEKKHETEEI